MRCSLFIHQTKFLCRIFNDWRHISRISILSRQMHPYTHTPHAIISDYACPHVSIRLSTLAQSDIMMWRAFVLLLIAKPSRLSRPMESFRHQPAQFIIRLLVWGLDFMRYRTIA
jgi:hypothetical protein